MFQATLIILANNPVDILLSLAWFAAFGVQVDTNDRFNCGSIWQWGAITDDTYCGRWKAAQAFSFLSAIVWAATALVVSPTLAGIRQI